VILFVRLALVAAAFVSAPSASSQGPAGSSSQRTTLEGVYTLAQANAGRDLFAGSCKECHSANVYAGQPLRARWNGRTLGELFGFLRREMPKSNAGSLSDQDYALVIAYMLRLNAMPTGPKPLVADSAALHTIRIVDTLSAPSSPRLYR
jgi:mono/diheme cytochrome c family protein